MRRPVVALWWFVLCSFLWSGSGVWGAPTSRPVPPRALSASRLVVFVPYQKLGALLRKEGVYLKKEQFERLVGALERARRALRRRLPVSSILMSARYEGQIARTALWLRVRLKLRVLGQGRWFQVPLPFAGLPLLSATLDGKSALLYARSGGGYMLLVRRAGVHELSLRFGGRVVQRQGWCLVELKIPPTPETLVSLRLQAKGWQLQRNGVRWKPTKGTLYEARLGPQTGLSLRWRPKAQQTVTQTRMMSAKVRLESRLDEGVIRTRARLSFHVLQGKVTRLLVVLPDEDKLVAVRGGERLRRWSLQKQGGQTRLLLQLRRPLQGHYHVGLEFERLLQSSKGVIAFSGLRVLGAQWQHGWVSLWTARTLEVKVAKVEGLTQMDPEEYAVQHQGPAPAEAFMYLKPGYQLKVEVHKIKARLRAEVFHRVHADEKQAVVKTRVRFRIERAGVFQLRFRLPKNWELREVRCPSMQNYYKDKGGLLVVTLSQKLGGPKLRHRIAPIRLWLLMRGLFGWRFLRQLPASQRAILRQRIMHPTTISSLQRLFGVQRIQASQPVVCRFRLRRSFALKDGFSLPLVQPLGLESEKGLIGVAVPSHLELRTSKRKGLMVIDDFSEAADVKRGRYQLRQAFRYAVRPVSGWVHLKRKKTSIQAQIWLPVKLREDGYQIRGIVRYKVLYAGIKRLKLTVPKAYAKRLQMTTSTREIHKKEGKQAVTYTLILERKIPKDGVFSLRFVLSVPFKQALRVGELEKLVLHAFGVPGATRQEVMWGLQKGESLSLQLLGHPGYERFDASELPDWATPRKVARTLRTQRKAAASIEVLLRKHRYARVLSTLVSHLHLEAVVNRDGLVQALALLQVKNRGRQFLKLKLPPKSKVSALKIAGRERYRFELDRKGELLIDLANLTDGQPFAVAVAYRHPLPAGQRLRGMSGMLHLHGPEAVDTPIAQSSLHLYLPRGIHYASFETQSWHRHHVLGLWASLRRLMWGREFEGDMPSFRTLGWLQREARGLLQKLPRHGRYFDFFTQTAAIDVQVHYRGLSWQWVLEFLFGLGTLLLLLFLDRRRWGWLPTARLSLLMILSLGLLSAVVPEAWVGLTYPMIFAWGGVSLFWMGRGIYRWGAAHIKQRGSSDNGGADGSDDGGADGSSDDGGADGSDDDGGADGSSDDAKEGQ